MRTSLVGAAALAGLTLLVAAGCGSDDNAEKTTAKTTVTTDAASVAGVTTTLSGQGVRDEVPEVAITAREHAFDLPASFEAGIVRLALRNAGAEPHGALFARLNNGVTAGQLTAALAEGSEAALPLVALSGGFANVEPGASDTLTIDLPAGEYVVLDLNPGADGVPNAAKGMIAPFTITGPARDVAAPSVNGEVVLGDFSFILPGLQGGPTTLKVTNAGRQPHELILYKLNPGATGSHGEHRQP